MMTSVFTRTDGSGTEKITLSSQDWCGQSFTQINKIKDKKYKIQLRSYFESEGDQEVTVEADLLEDELMNMIRIDPASIPTGDYRVLPSMVYTRLSHKSLKAKRANISKSETTLDEKEAVVLLVEYEADQRKVSITYEKQSPYKIISFDEEYPSAFDQQKRTTRAVKVNELHDAYWKMNHSKDHSKRSALDITGF